MEEAVKNSNLETAQTYIDFVKTNLEPLAQQLKVSVEWLWDILVMQARVEAIIYLVVCVAMFITSLILARVFFKSIKTARFNNGSMRNNQTWYVHEKTGKKIKHLGEDWDNRERYEQVEVDNSTDRNGWISYISGIGAAFLILVGIITSASSLEVIVTGLVNPQYRAIEKIVEFAKPKVEEVVEKK